MMGLACLLKIIANKNGCADQAIFNIGNPANDISIRELAELLLELIKTYPRYASYAEHAQLKTINSDNYYGKGYQDVERRMPSIKRAQQQLDWQPYIDIKTSLKKTLDFYLLH